MFPGIHYKIKVLITEIRCLIHLCLLMKQTLTAKFTPGLDTEHFENLIT